MLISSGQHWPNRSSVWWKLRDLVEESETMLILVFLLISYLCHNVVASDYLRYSIMYLKWSPNLSMYVITITGCRLSNNNISSVYMIVMKTNNPLLCRQVEFCVYYEMWTTTTDLIDSLCLQTGWTGGAHTLLSVWHMFPCFCMDCLWYSASKICNDSKLKLGQLLVDRLTVSRYIFACFNHSTIQNMKVCLHYWK